MLNKKIVIGVLVVIIIVGAAVWLWNKNNQLVIPLTRTSGEKNPLFSAKIEALLSKKIGIAAQSLNDPVILSGVRQANEQHKNISLSDIRRLDQRWVTTQGVDDFIKSFLTNAVALKLLDMQKQNPGFTEIFVTDAYGMNVGQTNKTSDYYQADEDWWTDTWAGGAGKAQHGPIEYDESAQTESIPLYIPILDPDTKKVIGIAKIVADINVISQEI